MVLYTIKNLLPIKDILKTLPFISINKYIKICKDSILEKQQWRNSAKWNKIKKSTKKSFSSAVFIEPCLWYKKYLQIIKNNNNVKTMLKQTEIRT